MLVSLGVAQRAHAETVADLGTPSALSGAEVTLAETLYREGRQLLLDRRYEEACLKFAESHRLDPATGTLLNLGNCHEAQGKFASAWLAFGEALRAARRELREDRVKFAEERLAAVELSLSRLTLAVTAPDLNGLQVKVDGVAIGPAAYGVASPIDPGTHLIEASAPGHKPWSTQVTIDKVPQNHLVTVPGLEPEPLLLPPSAPPSAGAAAPAPAPLPPPSLEMSPFRPLSAPVYVAGGATLVLTGAAILTGLSYMDKKEEYATLRKDESRSDRDKNAALDDAKRQGYMNVGFSAAAAIGAGLTAYFYATRPEQSRTSAVNATRLSVWSGYDAGGVLLRSEF